MIESVRINGYRCLSRFEMSELGRVNLLVGRNNSGKTSVLEALHLLASGGDPLALWQMLHRRGERMLDDPSTRRAGGELDISHLFHGHSPEIGAAFSISATNRSPEQSISFRVGEMSRKERESSRVSDRLPDTRRLALHVSGEPEPVAPYIPLVRGTAINADALDTPRRRRGEGSSRPPTLYVTTDSLSMDQLVSMWSRISLTDSEARVIRALQALDERIERIAPMMEQNTAYYIDYAVPLQRRGGFLIKRRGETPVPIGNMGDGVWRMLSLATAISRVQGGILFVDEIDTGLHYTVMADMWRMIAEVAMLLDVQVFATTHSLDCVNSLAAICESPYLFDRAVTIQRIEGDRATSVPFSGHEIAIAASRHIEIR